MQRLIALDAVMQPPMRQGLCARPWPPSRLMLRQFGTSAPRRNGKLLVRRFIPEEAKGFMTKDGRLKTTAENEAFIAEYELEPDNGMMVKMSGGDVGAMASRFCTTIAFSPSHIIAPYHLKYFDPRGHPLASQVRQQYARMVQARPLWIMATVVRGEAVVRASASQKLRGGLSKALLNLGYGVSPLQGQKRKIKGTIWLTIHDPFAVDAMNPGGFGRVVAKHLHEKHSKEI